MLFGHMSFLLPKSPSLCMFFCMFRMFEYSITTVFVGGGCQENVTVDQRAERRQSESPHPYCVLGIYSLPTIPIARAISADTILR